ncbi:unnamed protein product [Phytophthora lilii]|uniref:Unnamed protein product n=1 Tax=Phytophthora lilii TaxID=2077276 RepID=A0A9W6TIR5_9STRA|nr:unnamed protein product [Phytophthora lilii]
MALKDVSAVSRWSPAQSPKGSSVLSSAVIFDEVSALLTTASKKKPSAFTRAHSLEIPDGFSSNGDISMEDWTCTFQDTIQDTLDFFGDCISEELWLGLPQLLNDSPATEYCDHKLDVELPSAAYVTIATTTEPALTPKLNNRKQTKRPFRKQTKRVSSKKKIEALRDEVKQLTAQLQDLEAAQSQSEEEQANQQKSRAAIKPDRSQLWDHISKRQLQQRQKSEEENKKLRDILDTQIYEASSLLHVLKRRTKLEVETSRFRITQSTNE